MASSTTGVTEIAERYAAALFELAEQEKVLDEVAGDLKGLQGMIAESDDFKRLIRSPVISREDQISAVTAIMEAAGLNELTKKFVGTITQNRRLFALPEMVRSYLKLLADSRGEIAAEVVSAKPLSKTQEKELAAALKKAVGSDVAVHTRVDEDLIGGLSVMVGSQLVDNTIRTKLQQLRLLMKEA